MERRTFPILIFLILASGLNCSDKPTDRSKDARAIKKTYNEWVKVTNSKDIDRWSTFLAPNTVFLPPDHRPLEKYEEIIEYYIELFQDPLFKLECDLNYVQVAKSGEIAWARGRCEATYSDANGAIQFGSSKWTKIWIKQSDGAWKCRLNTWNYNEETVL